LPDIDNAVPTYPNPDVLSKQIEGLAALNSVDILGISVSSVRLVGAIPAVKVSNSGFTPLPEGAQEMPFSLSVRGSYSNLISFIKAFEGMRVAVKIDDLGISSSLTDKGRVIVAVISGRVPFLGSK